MMVIEGLVRVCFGLVDGVAWLFLQLVKGIIATLHLILGWCGAHFSELPENIAIPVVFILGVILVVGMVSLIYFAPHILFFVVVIVPVFYIVLRFLIGWIALFGIFYYLYHKTVQIVGWIRHPKEGGEIID
ncbi:hypothetical protein JZO77_03405 [Enterococcus hulanensis]|uniref:hypothetical protein n=1 Tax=Enterococcus hulanensis TaxID=2559929 RepID=UPI001A8E91A3|nr:hypothetical protein [Enterococcus hulanensis]MBO0455785.1 hypothetical protein [Enterococcus hulanensis]